MPRGIHAHFQGRYSLQCDAGRFAITGPDAELLYSPVTNDLAMTVARDKDLGLTTDGFAFVNPNIIAYVEFSSVSKVLSDLGRSNGANGHRAWYAVSTIKAGWPRYYAADGTFTVGAGAGSSFPVTDPEFYNDRGLDFMSFSGGDQGTGNRLIAAELFAGLGIRHAFCRYVLLIEYDVQPNMTDGVKLPGFAAEYEDTIFNPPKTGTITFSWRMIQFQDMVLADYLYDGTTGSSFGNHQTYPRQFPIAVPVTIEQELNVDGAQPKGNVWFNGEFVGVRNVVTDIDIEEIFLNVYHGGTGVSLAPMHYRLAGACIAKHYIGVPRELRSGTPLFIPGRGAGTPPVVNSFSATPAVISAGQSSNLQWATSAAASATLNGAPVATSGTQTVAPAATTTYDLSLTNPFGTTHGFAQVTVQGAGGTVGPPLWRQNWATPVGQWGQIPNTNPSSLSPLGVPNQNTDAYCGLAAVSDATRAMWVNMAGGGHVDSNWDGVFAIDLMQSTPSWRILLDASPASLRVNTTESAAGQPAVPYDHASPPKPNSCHTYYSLQFVPQRNRIIRPLAAALYIGSQNSPTMDGFDLGTNLYDLPGTYPNCLGNAAQAFVVTNPATGDIYYGGLSDSSMVKWTQSSNTWGPFTNPSGGKIGVTVWGYHGGCADTKRNRMVRAGLTSNGDFISKTAYCDFTTGVATLQPISGITDPAGLSNRGRMITWDSRNDFYYLTDSVGVWKIHPDAWTGVQMPGLPVLPTNSRINARFQYFPLLRGIVYCPNATSNLYFMATE